jgi:hypothetical protein
MSESTSRRHYVYGIIPKNGCETWDVEGIDKGRVFGIHSAAMTAVVSSIGAERLRPERRHLASHQRVLQHLLSTVTPIPFSFGTIVSQPSELIAFLEEHREDLQSQLEYLSGKVEMGLKVNLDVPNIFEFIIQRNEELRGMRDRMFWGGRSPSSDEKITIGKAFDEALQDDRQDHVETVLAVLEAHCVEVAQNTCRKEREVLSFACLVQKSGLEEFETAVLEAAKSFDNHFAFDYNGPWAPFGFVSTDPLR